MSAGGHVYSIRYDVIGSSSDTVHTGLIYDTNYYLMTTSV